MNNTVDDKNMIVMKLLHYFITEKNYNPIILQGAQDEIWLENMESDYKIVRIVSNHIHNDEQFAYDLFKTKHVVRKIKRKTLTFNINVLSIFTDISDMVALDNQKNYDCIYLSDEKDIKNYSFVTDIFPDITKKLKFNEDGMQLFLKITSDINKKNRHDQEEAEDVFKPKNPIITKILIGINIFIYLFALITNQSSYFINKFAIYGPFITKYHEYYRLITGCFIHANIFHLLFNCYALYIIGSQIESFYGKAKYIIIYFLSALSGSLLSVAINNNAVSIGASGAIFGLMGSLVYFGYHYRVYLGSVIRSQIIPIIILNLLIGFAFSNQIDNFAHIGGLIGGFLISMGVGVKYKSTKSEIINGIILYTIFTVFLLLLIFKVI